MAGNAFSQVSGLGPCPAYLFRGANPLLGVLVDVDAGVDAGCVLQYTHTHNFFYAWEAVVRWTPWTAHNGPTFSIFLSFPPLPES